MAEPTTIETLTNTTPKSCVDVDCDCNTMWSLAQQFSTMRLCSHTGEYKGKLLYDYPVRARRIAATYARFYLETEDGGDITKKGRYYWMALGAFASKTVACTFENWQVNMMSYGIDTVWEGLGKGNFWLFCDISGWHWYHNMYPGSFDKCLSERNASKYVEAIQKQMDQLPWKAESLPVIDNFAVSKEIKTGFSLVKKIETAKNIKTRQDTQLAHLLAIAVHEQNVILQRLIYANEDFAYWTASQRNLSWITPGLELVFGHECALDMAKYKSIAPDDMELESFESRMIWIRKTAKEFHFLMISEKVYMEKELNIIAGWVEMPDVEPLKRKLEKARNKAQATSHKISDAIKKRMSPE